MKNKALWIYKRFVQHKEANLFFVIALCTGIVMACITPPFQECDGWTHYLYATEVSYGNLFSPMADLPSHKAGIITIPKNLDELNYHITEVGNGEGGEYIQYLKGVVLSEKRGELFMPGRFVSLFYYPQALGLWLGRTFQMSVYGLVVLSRALNLLVFLILGYFAVQVTPILKNTIAAIALLPITLFQAASDSPDSLLNGLCLLFICLCFYYAYGKKESLGWKEAATIGLLLGVIFLYKYVYVCLGLLVFLIPVKKFGGKKVYWKYFALAMILLSIFGYIGMGNAISIASAGQAVTQAGGITQSQYLMEHPKVIFQMLINTFLYKFGEYVLMLNVLGSLNYPLGAFQLLIPMFLIFAACIDINQECCKIRLKDKVLCIATVLIVGMGIVLAMYLAEGRGNKVGALVAGGVQGRYFIPVLPALFVSIQQQGAQNMVKYVTRKILGMMGVFLLCTIYMLYLYCF